MEDTTALRHLDLLALVFEAIEKDNLAILERSQPFEPPRLALKLPQDLVELNEQIGNCPSCNCLTSKLLLCYYCGFKVC